MVQCLADLRYISGPLKKNRAQVQRHTCFQAPLLLPLSPKSVSFFPAVTEQPSQHTFVQSKLHTFFRRARYINHLKLQVALAQTLQMLTTNGPSRCSSTVDTWLVSLFLERLDGNNVFTLLEAFCCGQCTCPPRWTTLGGCTLCLSAVPGANLETLVSVPRLSSTCLHPSEACKTHARRLRDLIQAEMAGLRKVEEHLRRLNSQSRAVLSEVCQRKTDRPASGPFKKGLGQRLSLLRYCYSLQGVEKDRGALQWSQ